MMHRRAKFRAAPETAGQLDAAAVRGEVEMVIPYQLHGLHGAGGALEAVEVAGLDGGTKVLAADVLLPFFGLSMDLGAIAGCRLGLERNHVVVTPATCETVVAGVFAIGDVAIYPGKLKLILQGFSEAAMAAHAIHPIVFPETALHFEYSTTKGVPGAYGPFQRQGAGPSAAALLGQRDALRVVRCVPIGLRWLLQRYWASDASAHRMGRCPV